jgi:hypothetical protein
MGITVLFVTGWCRSGSTVFGNTLAEVPSVFHTGELRFLWQNGVLGTGTNRRCGCGTDLVDCPLWSKVVEAGRPADRSLVEHAKDVVRWQHDCRTRHTGKVLRRPPENGWPTTLAATYQAIADQTGASVIVDSSKYASDAAVATHLKDIRTFQVQLVRDPRAVAYSWLKPKDYTGRRNALNSTWFWLGFNHAAEQVRKARPNDGFCLRYEDMVADPRAAVEKTLRLLDLPVAANPVSDDGGVELGPNHTVTGNPNRFERGRTRLSLDTRWHTGLKPVDRLASTVLAAPQLSRYGYSWRP